jgi:hypothetical protein
MKIRLDLIESRLQQLIEHWMVPVAKRDFQSRLAHQLVQALQEHLMSSKGHPTEAIALYTIFLHPEKVIAFERQENLLANLALALQEAAREAELYLASPPIIHLESDDSLIFTDFRVEVSHNQEKTGTTAVLRLHPEAAQQEMFLKKAFLIVNGNELCPLDRAVINIGRRTDNHLIIEDARVSRNHAQIRFSRGAFTLFDLNSTGGTKINGQPVRQAPLKPGDVISLSGFPLIYGEDTSDSSRSDDTGQTQVMRNPPP